MAEHNSIATAPRDGTEVQLIDIFADTPRWGVGFWIEQYGAYFDGYQEDYESVCDDIESGDLDPAELELMFWPQPTHWAPVLPIPELSN